jgi:hypothetical protein
MLATRHHRALHLVQDVAATEQDALQGEAASWVEVRIVDKSQLERWPGPMRSLLVDRKASNTSRTRSPIDAEGLEHQACGVIRLFGDRF